MRRGEPAPYVYRAVHNITKEHDMSQKLKGKVAVVTGASKGIGAAIAGHLAAEGAAVVVDYATDRAGAERVVAEIVRNGGQGLAVQANVAKLEDIQRLFAEAKRAFGRVDVLVNNAGVYEFAGLEDVTTEHFHKHFDVNVLGLLLSTREAVKHFSPEGGSVINIGSVAGSTALANTSVYSATKAAVDAVTRVLATELGPRKIRVNALNPGMVETEGVRAAGFDQGEFRKKVEAETPLGRIGQPKDMGPVAVFLASDDSGWITGETLQVAGGNR
ncbi:SDR family NAD(P)-dependent oxidoreductase [Anaeromyxobacter diazotrophicus]|uniref:Oxidoreductase n=1 Tax=Anaeromyxobacter diazotrophicus TaxID=2590199 RepID=A0A7I9VLW1_9BACT|nr:glucose 1-dehydrogenase [Anaeromyxobacter diazotrophicus]GEJ57396.1 oxidoreductase [Anaeromyxobacter diazotrophicus]